MAHRKKNDSDDFYDSPKRNLDHMFEEYENGTRSIFKSLNRDDYEEQSDSNAESDNEDVKPDITISFSRNNKDGLKTEIGLPSPENILREQEENLVILRKNIKKGTIDDKIELAEALLEKAQILLEWLEEDESAHLQKDIDRTFSELNKLIDDIRLDTDDPRVTRLAIDSALQRGIFFFDQSDPQSALKSYSICMIEQNRLLQTQPGLEEEMAGVRLNIATCYDMLNQPDKVETYALEAINLFRIAKAHPDPDQPLFDKYNLDYYLAKTMLLLAHRFFDDPSLREKARPYLCEAIELFDNIVIQFNTSSSLDEYPSLSIHDDIFHTRQLLYQIDEDKLTTDEKRNSLEKLACSLENAIHPICDEESLADYFDIQRIRCELELDEHQYRSAITIIRETFDVIDTDSPVFKEPDMCVHLITLYELYSLSYVACGRHRLALRYIQTAITLLRRNIYRIKKAMTKARQRRNRLPKKESAPFLLKYLQLRMSRVFSWIQLFNLLIQKARLLYQHGVYLSSESKAEIQKFQELIEFWVNRLKDKELLSAYQSSLTGYKEVLKQKSQDKKD